MVRSAALLFLFLLPACQTAPAPDDAGAARLHEQNLDALISLVTSAPATESAAISELCGRLARLTDVLERMAPDGTHTSVRDASARDASATRAVADSATLQGLQDALLLAERQRDLLLQNIANVNAPAYQRVHLQLTTRVDPCSGLVLPIAAAERRETSTGAIEITDRNLDLAIDGYGYFVLQNAHGPRFTREGGLLIDVEGRLVSGTGAVLEPGITIPNDTLEIAIDPEGRVQVRTASRPDVSQALGTLVLARFADDTRLVPADGGTFALAADACPPSYGTPGQDGIGTLKQGFLERSNVQLSMELLELQRCERTLRGIRRVLAEYGVFTR